MTADEADRFTRRTLRALHELPSARRAELAQYTWTVNHLMAAIARAALERVSVLAPLHRSDGSILALQGEDLDRFLRPIFEEAGIGDSFAP